MAYQTPFFGYPGIVWSTVFASFNYLNEQISQDIPIATIAKVAQTVFNTCLNGLNAINAYRVSQAWAAEVINISAVQALPITISPSIVTELNNRASAITMAQVALNAIIPNINPAEFQTLLSQNLPAIPSCDTLTFFQNFQYETPPPATTNANIPLVAQSLASDFNTLAQTIAGFQGFYTTPAYDTALRLYQSSQVIANILTGLTAGPFSNVLSSTYNWNQTATLPAILLEAYSIISAPFSLPIQQQEVIRYVIIYIMLQLATLLLILRQPVATTLNLAELQQGDTLLDLAARALGDFEQWPDIAQINNLLPPYVGPTAQPNIAEWGSNLVMPGPGSGTSATGAQPNYALNFLGIDLYVGPINGSMPPWTGDFQTISGYNNLRWALGRRMQTTLGTLIYHNDYGSRIPPEVGSVQTNATAKLITAFGKSCLLSDPRVSQVIAASTTVLPNFALAFQASVQPKGFGTPSVTLNEVLSPFP